MTDLQAIKRTYIIGVEDKYVSEVLCWWIHYDKPCNLLFVKPKTEGLTAIKVTVETNDTANFVLKLKDRIKCNLFEAKKID